MAIRNDFAEYSLAFSFA